MVSTTNAEMDPCPRLQNEKVFLIMWYPDSTGCSHSARGLNMQILRLTKDLLNQKLLGVCVCVCVSVCVGGSHV